MSFLSSWMDYLFISYLFISCVKCLLHHVHAVQLSHVGKLLYRVLVRISFAHIAYWSNALPEILTKISLVENGGGGEVIGPFENK